MQAVSLVERPRACIVHPSAQCAAAAQDSLHIFEPVGDRRRAAFSELLLAVEGVGAPTPTPAALQHADREFAALGDDWGRAVAAFVRMENLTYHADQASARQRGRGRAARFRRLEDGWGLSAVLYHFGWALTRFGAPRRRRPVLQEAIEVAATAGVYNTVQWATADLGLALLALGRVDEASAYFARAGHRPRPGRRRRRERRSPPTAQPSSPRKTATTPPPGPSSTTHTTPLSVSGCRSPPDRHWPG